MSVGALLLSEENNSLADQDRCSTYAAIGAYVNASLKRAATLLLSYGSLNNTNCGGEA